MEPAVITMVDILLRFGYYVCFLSFCGLAFSPTPHNLERDITDYCTTGWFENARTMVFASTSLGCGIFTVSGVLNVKLHLLVSTKMRVWTADTLFVKWILFSTQVVLGAGFALLGLMMFYFIQLKFGKFSCMGIGTQTAVVGFMSALAITLLPVLYKSYVLSDEYFHARLLQETSEKDEESKCYKLLMTANQGS